MFKLVLPTLVSLSVFSGALAENLTINSIHSDPEAKKAFELVLAGFKKENPAMEVKVNTIDHESYKVQLRTWLPTNPPDVATWFAGNRAGYFVEKGLIEPIDDIWKEFENEFPESAKSVVTFSGKKYLVPANYYHWGFYYRKDLFSKAGITETPSDWEQFKASITKLKALDVTPIAIGTKQGWPAAGWFDFVNMRVNGADFHLNLLNGKESFTDPKVKKSFDTWAQVVDMGAFPKNAPALTWQEARGLLFQGKAAMYLMGNFLVGDLPADQKDKLGFFPFPTIDKSIADAQVAPTDVYFIPSKAKNKESAKKFLKYMLRADVQTQYNQVSGLLPPNLKSKVDPSNPYLVQGQQLLSKASRLSQFFDRDADPEVAKVGMDGFVEFMSDTKKSTKVLTKLQSVSARVHKSKVN
jgi:multiple sugar transport system substrate-binding protein